MQQTVADRKGDDMRSKDTALIEQIKKSIEKAYEESGRTPSVREIATEVGCSYSTVSRYLTEMMSRGVITREGGMYETETIAKMNLETVPVAVVGSVSCGPLTFAEENIEEYIKLPKSLLGAGKFFILHASGQSMIGAGIEDGDLVVILQQETAEPGQIVVALVEDEVTLKRFFPDPQNGCIRLHPENKRMKDIIVDNCQIQGVAVKVLKDLL